jgi:hypothetical protein
MAVIYFTQVQKDQQFVWIVRGLIGMGLAYSAATRGLLEDQRHA